MAYDLNKERDKTPSKHTVGVRVLKKKGSQKKGPNVHLRWSFMMLPVRLLQSTPNHLQQSSPTQEESLLEGSSSPSLNLRRALLCISMQPTVKFPALELDHIASSEINSVVSKRRKIRSTE